MIKVTRDDDLNIHGRTIKRPTVIFDNDNYAMIKIGEYEEIEEYYKTMRKSLNNISKLNRKLSTMGLPALTKPLERSLELMELLNGGINNMKRLIKIISVLILIATVSMIAFFFKADKHISTSTLKLTESIISKQSKLEETFEISGYTLDNPIEYMQLMRQMKL
mgnify:CR=1 FL=1